VSGPVISVASVEDVQIFLKDPVYTYFFTATMVTRTRQNVTFRYVACLFRNLPVSDTVQFLLTRHVIS